MALLMSVATAFFLAAMPMTVDLAVHLLVAGSAALLAGGLTWAAVSFAGRATHSGPPRPAFVMEEGLPHGEEYPKVPGWRPIFASEIGSPDAETPIFELTDVVATEEPATMTAPIEPHSIAALIARLETAIERRSVEARKIAQAPAAPGFPDIGGDGTLRNVLNELQRMAVAGGR